MTRILLDCTFCGDITLQPDQIIVTVYPDREAIEYDCPICATPMDRECHPKAKAVLEAVGVEIVPAVPLPEAVVEALRNLRNSDRRIISSFECELASVETVEDIGWVK